MILPIALLVIFACCFAFVFNEGLWGAAIMFFNVMTAALLATNLFEPAANWITGMSPSMAYLADFIALWAIFVISLLLMRVVTDLLSRHRVRFIKIADTIGGMFFAAWIGWIVLQFTMFTLHTAPLSRNFLGFQEKPDTRMLFHLGPDRDWLAFIHSISKDGALARESSANQPDVHVFDPNADFILRYGARRQQLEKESSILSKK
jgi:uncharacterized membrane protein required for colicin V production